MNRATFSIDGTELPGVVRFESTTGQKTAQRDQAAASGRASATVFEEAFS